MLNIFIFPHVHWLKKSDYSSLSYLWFMDILRIIKYVNTRHYVKNIWIRSLLSSFFFRIRSESGKILHSKKSIFGLLFTLLDFLTKVYPRRYLLVQSLNRNIKKRYWPRSEVFIANFEKIPPFTTLL